MIVLDPTAAPPTDAADPGPDFPDLRGARIGFRLDILWPAWDWVAEEWTRLLEADGAVVTHWRAPPRMGEGTEAINAALRAWLATVDAALVGLANCGSCTSWTVHDALAAHAARIPVAAICTRQFETLGRALARRSGRSGLRFEVLPYPLSTLQEDDVRDIARRQYRSLLRTLGVRGEVADQSAA